MKIAVVRLKALVARSSLLGMFCLALYLASASVLPVAVVYLIVACVLYCLVIYMTASAYARRYIRRCVKTLFVNPSEKIDSIVAVDLSVDFLQRLEAKQPVPGN